MVIISYLPADNNILADTASRRWDLTDTAPIALFNTHFPHRYSWQICPVTPVITRRMIYMLRGGSNGKESVQDTPTPAKYIGANGWTSDPGSPLPQTSLGYLTKYPTSRCSPIVSGWAHWQQTGNNKKSHRGGLPTQHGADLLQCGGQQTPPRQPGKHQISPCPEAT